MLKRNISSSQQHFYIDLSSDSSEPSVDADLIRVFDTFNRLIYGYIILYYLLPCNLFNVKSFVTSCIQVKI